MILGGALGAGLVIGLLHFAAKPGDLPLLGQSLFGLLLGATGMIYLGAALSKGEPRWLAAELAASLAVLALAFVGLWGSPKWLVAGYALHALWGAVHGPRLVKTPVVEWLPPLSAAFDVVVAAWILWRL